MAINVNINVSTPAASFMAVANPGAISWMRINADNSVTLTSAAQTRSDLGFEPAVRATTLTGLSVTGTTIVSTDTVLQAFGKTQNQINALIGGVNYQGTWNATTNSPALASGVGTKGYYYVVSVAGSTNLDGITDWKLGDWAIFNGTTWEKVDNTDAVISVNGYVGAVTLVKADVGLGNVENTALSTWAGTTNITTVGTIGTGTWSATEISVAKGGTGLTALGTALQQLRVNAGGTALEYFTPSSGGITIGSTPITGGATGLVLYQKSDGTVQASGFKYDASTIIDAYSPMTITLSGGVSNTLRINNGGGASLLNMWEGVALGIRAVVYNSFTTDKVSIGDDSTATGAGSTALGAHANANQSSSLALGSYATATAAHQCVIGSPTYYYDNLYFNGVTHTAPFAVNIRGTGGSGTNINGANVGIYAGLPTGDGSSTAAGRNGYINFWTGDVGASGTTLRSATEKMRLVQGGDLVLGITSYTKGLVLQDSAGHYWRISVSTLGALTTADLGTSIPT